MDSQIAPLGVLFRHPFFLSAEIINYTQSRKKRTMESWISFWEECRYKNFAVYFIFPMLWITLCKKPHSKIVHGSLTLLRSMSTSKITKIQPLTILDIHGTKTHKNQTPLARLP